MFTFKQGLFGGGGWGGDAGGDFSLTRDWFAIIITQKVLINKSTLFAAVTIILL